MNTITKGPLKKISHDFMVEDYRIDEKDQYFIRNQQSDAARYRSLTSSEIETLVKHNNSAEDWDKILVSEHFDPELVRNCEFYGLVRLGNLEKEYLEFHKLRLPVGITNSMIISCDIGDNVVIRNARYLSHYIIGNHSILFNIDEMFTVDTAKFGNGIVKEGEPENVRIWLEVCNENGGRSILPFSGILPADGYLWSRYREDSQLMECFKKMTDDLGDTRRGFYGKVGDRSVIKNSRIIKDVLIGSDAYIKGANKLKNLTINSSEKEPTQIGEGSELVNGIIGFGNRIFYGVKAVRFVTGRNVQLKYGARLINSFLGSNSTISCCEVLNNLIFPFHEQHHNNSFLIASMIEGQSNIAAGATIGSNHNSRGADGEITAKRGFWPGLMTTFKHNSKFASFVIVSKGNYNSEMDIRFPFSLVTTGETLNEIVIIPAYWFQYNLYAFMRTSWTFANRDKRVVKEQNIEFDYLAPDTVEEMFDAVTILEKLDLQKKTEYTGAIKKGFSWIYKGNSGLKWYRDMIFYYGFKELILYLENCNSAIDTLHTLDDPGKQWINMGGQIIRMTDLTGLINRIKSGSIRSWEQLHCSYGDIWEDYRQLRIAHGIHSLLRLENIRMNDLSCQWIENKSASFCQIAESLKEKVFDSKEKDFSDPFRKMVYRNEDEMRAVLGSMDDIGFVKDFRNEQDQWINKVKVVIKNFKKKNS